MNQPHKDPTYAAAVAMEIKEKNGCGVCTRGQMVMADAYVCTVGKQYPACRRCPGGFVYDDGECDAS